jgi:tetratricopeptide (TPR) repeat protein
VLKDGDDAEALSLLADDAEERSEFTEAVEYLARLGRASTDNAQRATVSLRQARLLADGAKDVDLAIEQYERVLSEYDPENQEALAAIADLEEKREKYDATARALERQLKLVSDPAQKVEIAGRLADLYETRLEEPKNALRALNVVFAADPDDFQAVQRIVEIAEKLEEWSTVAEHMARLVEVEGDEEEVSRMTCRLAEILSEKLDRGEDALTALGSVAEQGDAPCREAFIELGDRLGRKKLVASRLVEWFGQSPPSPERDKQLHGAFERFVEVGADEEAATVGKELARMRVAQRDIAVPLEEVSIRIKDLDALSVAHDLLVRELSGPARAEEMVRQAEVLLKAGVEALEAVQHGEQALTSIAPAEVEPLLDRLGKLLDGPAAVIDLYERQVGRCKSPADRLTALARAAQVAAERDALERSRGFFDIAIGAGAQDETLEALERIARATDEARDTKALRGTLAEALAAGGQGSRDGGRTRSALLRRAAILAHRELSDRERAFAWLGDALVTHVEDTVLDTLVELAREVGEPERAEIVLGRALGEVFDGPLVRKLLARRADLRAEFLNDKRGAAEDLKRLHELAPADTEVMEKLSALYTELEDYRGMVALYEDQILRGRDQSQRAELARKVARLWEERLDDAREAADAWRRVLRMKAGDPDATAGLERAKSNMLKKPSSDDEDFAPLKAKAPSAPPPAPPAPDDEAESSSPPAESETTAMDLGGAAAEPDAGSTPESETAEAPQQPTTPPAPAVAAELALQTAPAVRAYTDEEMTLDEPIPQALLDAARGILPPSAAEAESSAADSDEVDVDVDLASAAEPHALPTPSSTTSHPPPAPSRRSSLPPPPRSSPSASGGKPPPPPSLRTSRPPPPPSRSGGPPPLRSGPPPPPPTRAKAPPPPKGKKGKSKKNRSKDDNGTAPNLNGDEPSEEVVDDDELFE